MRSSIRDFLLHAPLYHRGVYGSWLMAHGSWLMAHGSWLLAHHGSWLMAHHGSWLMAHRRIVSATGWLYDTRKKLQRNEKENGFGQTTENWHTPVPRPVLKKTKMVAKKRMGYNSVHSARIYIHSSQR